MQETTTAARHQDAAHYAKASPAAQATMDAVFNAVAKVTSPDHWIDYHPLSRAWRCNFTWHDGAEYRVTVNEEGVLLRLFRLQYTGRWVEEGGEEVPEESWRYVRALTKDRSGRSLGPALAGRAAAPSWVEAAGR